KSRSGPRVQSVQEGVAEEIAAEQAVQIAAHHPAVGRHRSIRPAGQLEEWSCGIGAGGGTDMYLIAGDRRAARTVTACALHQPLLRAHDGLEIEQSQALHRAARPIDAFGVVDPAAKHLVAAANSENMAASSQMRGQVHVPTLSAQECEVTGRRLRSREDN